MLATDEVLVLIFTIQKPNIETFVSVTKLYKLDLCKPDPCPLLPVSTSFPGDNFINTTVNTTHLSFARPTDLLACLLTRTPLPWLRTTSLASAGPEY